MKEANIKVIKKLTKEGMGLHQIAKEMDLSLDYVQGALDIIKEQNKVKSLPVQIGHFKKVLAEKKEQHAQLMQTEKMLTLNISALWDMVKMLEHKKNMLENHIKDMENYIKKGSKVADVFIKGDIPLQND